MFFLWWFSGSCACQNLGFAKTIFNYVMANECSLCHSMAFDGSEGMITGAYLHDFQDRSL